MSKTLSLMLCFICLLSHAYSQDKENNLSVQLGYHFIPFKIRSTTVNSYNAGPALLFIAQHNLTKYAIVSFTTGIKYFSQKPIKMELQPGGTYNSRDGAIYKTPLSIGFGFKGIQGHWRPFIYVNGGLTMTTMALKAKDYSPEGPPHEIGSTDDYSTESIPTVGVRSGVDYFFSKAFSVSATINYDYERWNQKFAFDLSIPNANSSWFPYGMKRIYDINMKSHYVYLTIEMTYHI
ncbi:outer membrane beta-barrel protein [bacterium]|nr:outer membrane beta-barrel protein [bacterium]